MNRAQENQLLDYLGSLGFTGDELAREIHKKQEKRFPSFRVKYDISYGEEKVRFDLEFRRDHQFNAYRLEEYKATHRRPVVIERQVINGVDTAELEKRMKEIDWNSYFKNNDHFGDVQLNKNADAILNDLWNLDAENNAEGLLIQKQLQYQYFPEHTYDPAAMYFRSELEHSRTFLPHEAGMCNTDLAYHIVSGRLDNLYEKLTTTALDQYSGRDLYMELERILSNNPDSFELKFNRNEPDGFSELTLPVNKVNGEYSADIYTMTLTPYPPVEHGIYNDIDSKKLEDLMREIDWHDDRQLFTFREDQEPEFPSRVSEVQNKIYRLSQHASGAETADKLQLKYWSDASFFEGVVDSSAWDHLAALPKRTQAFPLDTEAKAAFNLLSGRAVMEQSSPDSDSWIRLNLNKRDEQGNYPAEQIKGFSNVELENVLDVFPIPQSRYYQVKNSLVKGDLVTVKLVNDRRVVMEANPEQQTVNVYTPDMRFIPTNVHLDPDWKPPLNEAPGLNQTEQQRQTNIRQ